MKLSSWTKVKAMNGPFDREIRPAYRIRAGRVIYEWFGWGKLIACADNGCWEVHAGDCPPPSHVFWTDDHYLRSVLLMAIKKLQKVAGPSPQAQHGLPSDGALYPTLWEHLSLQAYEDGTKRQPSMLMVFSENGRWKGALKDTDNERICWKMGDTLEELLSTLEDAATRDDPSDWRRSEAKPATRGKRS